MSRIRTAVVTGATGFVGSALARRLVRGGVEVVALTRQAGVRTHLVPGARWIACDYSLDALREIFSAHRPQTLFHLAAYGVLPGDRDPGEMAAGNVTLIANLLQAAAVVPGIRVVYSGSCFEYASASPGVLMTEAHPLEPGSLYGAAKVAAHAYGRVLARHLGVWFSCLRLFGMYGAGEAPGRLLPSLIRSLSRDEPIDLTAGEQVRDLIAVEDAVEACVRVSEADGCPADSVFNVCSGAGVRIRDLASLTAGLMHKRPALLRFGARPSRQDEAPWIVGDGRRIRQELGWEPQVPLAEGIKRLIGALSERRAA